MKPAILLWLSTLALAMSALATDVDQDDENDALQRLLDGEILSENIREDESGGAGRVVAYMDAPLKSVWDIVISCEQTFRYVRGMRECEVLEETGEFARIRQSVKQHWMAPRIDFVFVADRIPFESIEVRLLEGDLQTLEGSWKFETLSGHSGTIVTHEIRIRPRLPAPRWMVRRSLRRDLPDMMACIRGLAAPPGQEAGDASDLERCQPYE